MEGLKESMDAAIDEMRQRENLRETSIQLSRRITRLSKMVIHSTHLGEPCDDRVDEMIGMIRELTSLGSVSETGPAPDALGEYAEAMILRDLVSHGRVPGHSALGIPAGPWLLGLADSEGELRRMITGYLMNGDIQSARMMFTKMETVHDTVMMLDIPDAVLSMRRKQDIARGLMDKTRSELLMAKIMDVQ